MLIPPQTQGRLVLLSRLVMRDVLLQLFQELREGLRTVEIGGEAHGSQIKIPALRLSVQFCSKRASEEW